MSNFSVKDIRGVIPAMVTPFDEKMCIRDSADAQRVRVVRVFDMDDLSVFADFAFFRLIHAKEHAHQSGFAREMCIRDSKYTWCRRYENKEF